MCPGIPSKEIGAVSFSSNKYETKWFKRGKSGKQCDKIIYQTQLNRARVSISDTNNTTLNWFICIFKVKE